MQFSTRSRRCLIALVLLALVSLVGLATATLFNVPWWTVDGGGAQGLSGGDYQLSGTAGQPDAGRLSGGVFVLNGGLWATSLPAGQAEARHWELYR